MKAAIVIVCASLAAFTARLERSFKYPYPPFTNLVWDVSRVFEGRTSVERPIGSEGGFRDLGGICLGMRRMTADIAWIAVLQYYGAYDMLYQGAEAGSGPGVKHPALKVLVQRAIRLDPYFHFAYLYGAGSLAFNLDRSDEALELLEEGIKYNPTYWRLRLYLAAIVWKKKGQYDNMIPLLEEAIAYPDCPTMVKSCLANIYKARKNYGRALQIWLAVLEQRNLDEVYEHQATLQVEDLRKKLGI